MSSFDLSALPRWVFAFAALIIAMTAVYGMFFADCKTQLFGLQFGKDRPCAMEDSELFDRIQSLELAVAASKDSFVELGTRERNSVSLTITNHGKGDTGGCPEGMFVSAVSAPGGVGGRYAIDGINRISYKCSAIFIE